MPSIFWTVAFPATPTPATQNKPQLLRHLVLSCQPTAASAESMRVPVWTQAQARASGRMERSGWDAQGQPECHAAQMVL